MSLNESRALLATTVFSDFTMVEGKEVEETDKQKKEGVDSNVISVASTSYSEATIVEQCAKAEQDDTHRERFDEHNSARSTSLLRTVQRLFSPKGTKSSVYQPQVGTLFAIYTSKPFWEASRRLLEVASECESPSTLWNSPTQDSLANILGGHRHRGRPFTPFEILWKGPWSRHDTPSFPSRQVQLKLSQLYAHHFHRMLDKLVSAEALDQEKTYMPGAILAMDGWSAVPSMQEALLTSLLMLPEHGEAGQLSKALFVRLCPELAIAGPVPSTPNDFSHTSLCNHLEGILTDDLPGEYYKLYNRSLVLDMLEREVEITPKTAVFGLHTVAAALRDSDRACFSYSSLQLEAVLTKCSSTLAGSDLSTFRASIMASFPYLFSWHRVKVHGDPLISLWDALITPPQTLPLVGQKQEETINGEVDMFTTIFQSGEKTLAPWAARVVGQWASRWQTSADVCDLWDEELSGGIPYSRRMVLFSTYIDFLIRYREQHRKLPSGNLFDMLSLLAFPATIPHHVAALLWSGPWTREKTFRTSCRRRTQLRYHRQFVAAVYRLILNLVPKLEDLLLDSTYSDEGALTLRGWNGDAVQCELLLLSLLALPSGRNLERHVTTFTTQLWNRLFGPLQETHSSQNCGPTCSLRRMDAQLIAVLGLVEDVPISCNPQTSSIIFELLDDHRMKHRYRDSLVSDNLEFYRRALHVDWD